MVRGGIRAVAGAVIIAGAAVLSGCLPGTTTAAPSASAAPTETSAAPAPARVLEIEALDVPTYVTLPQEERLAYVDYRLVTNAAHHAISVEGKNRPMWTPVTRDMPGQQILDNFIYLSDEAGFAVQVTSEGEKLLWIEEAIKLQSGAYWDSPGPASMSNAFDRDLDFILSREGESPFLTDQAWTLVRDGATIAGVDQGRVPVTLRDIVFTDATGVTVTGRFNFVEFTAFDGQLKAAWLLDSIRT